jgi:hypothetical protein
VRLLALQIADAPKFVSGEPFPARRAMAPIDRHLKALRAGAGTLAPWKTSRSRRECQKNGPSAGGAEAALGVTCAVCGPDYFSGDLPVRCLYERTEFNAAPREADDFVCPACGHTLEIFTSAKAPHYRLISGPPRKPEVPFD